MKIELNREEIEAALIAHVTKLFPGKWTVYLPYGYAGRAEFTKAEDMEKIRPETYLESPSSLT